MDWKAYTDASGRLVFSRELAAWLGLEPGVNLHIDEKLDGLLLRRPITQLAKVYIEPTSACNLACRTCIRNAWDEPQGSMDHTTFSHIVEGLRTFPLPLTVFFGGYGEPLSHPLIIEMVAQVKALGVSVELITNGTLLDETRARGLIDAGLDVLWVSLDGATPESYTDVRLGAALPKIIANLERFRELRRRRLHRFKPELGIAFVAMKRNIGDLPALLRLARELGASRFLVTNVLPHTAQMRDEALYSCVLSNNFSLPSPHLAHLSLPQMDAHTVDNEALALAINGSWYAGFTRDPVHITKDRCPFIERGALAIGWDGSLSPCLPLLHDHNSYLNGLERFSRRYVVGNVTESALQALWHAPEYRAFRQKVQDFDFAPCDVCDGCVLSENNEEDCYGNAFPTCGGCLWAQGIIQCP